MQSDEYELMPREELEYLRKEVDKLKRNPLGDTQASISLLDSLNKLNANVEKLNRIFEGANDEMVKTFNDKDMQEQLRRLGEQQEKLAKGIVAVSELVKEVQQKQTKMPDIEQLIAQSKAGVPPPLQLNAQSLQADLQAMPPVAQSKNPFDDALHPGFAPLLNHPLPRPGTLAPPATPMPANAQHSAIPDMDVPPPPPKRY